MVTLALLSGGTATAQDAAEPPQGFDAHGLWLAPHDADLRDPLVVPRPGALVQGDWFLSGVFEYARAPLVRVVDGGATEEVIPVVDNLVALNLSTAVAVHDRIRLGVGAPVYGVSTGGEDLVVSGPTFGDVRANAMVLLARPAYVEGGGGPGLGLLGHLDLPSGAESRFLGQPGLGGGVGLAGTYELPTATLTAHVGAQFVPGVEAINVSNPDSLVTGLAATFATSRIMGVTLEAVAQPPLSDWPKDSAGNALLPPSEAMMSAKVAPDDGTLWTFGAAGGLGDGPGVATFRVFLGLGYAKLTDPAAPDHDVVGVVRTSDGCPLEPETVNGYKDDDGCPDRLGALVVEATYKGQARTATGDLMGPDGAKTVTVPPQGYLEDAVPGTSWSAKLRDGCLQGEGSTVAGEAGGTIVVSMAPVYDARVVVEAVGPDDAPIANATTRWVSERPECVPAGLALSDDQGKLAQQVASGKHKVVVTAPEHTVVEQEVELLPGDDRVIRVRLGATKIVVEKEQIRILEKVQFETAKAIIRPESYGLLDEVAAVILANPDLGRVEVGGHTDDRGSDTYNQELSEARAKSVAAYLAGKGVDPARLVAVGYGETKPLQTNRTEPGREANRRVEFNLIDQQQPKPEATP